MSKLIPVKIQTRRELTPQITEFTLISAHGENLPSSDAGAHIGVETPDGAWRQYSIINPAQTPANYTLAIKREDNGRGDSASLHTEWQQDTQTNITAPQNSFPLTSASEYLLIAGGIGVTPIYAMAQSLAAQGAKLSMIYCTRSRPEAAFASELEQLLGDQLTLHHDEGDISKVYDFWDHFEQPKDCHVFCCGPVPLMEEVKAVSGHWPEGRIHFENFAGAQAIQNDDKAFDVTLSKSQQTITIPSDKTILETLRAHDIPVVSSCESGTCGTCKCTLISGLVDHRDHVLMNKEKANSIMICVSRAQSGDLVLDL